jgi:hypothetical protein
MHILSALLVCCALAVGEQPPIFDVHLHADSPDHWPQGRIKACPGDRAKTWPAIDPRSAHVTPDDLEDCPNPVYSLESEQAVLAETRRLMEKYNISGSVSGPGPAGGPQVWQQNNYRTALTIPRCSSPF